MPLASVRCSLRQHLQPSLPVDRDSWSVQPDGAPPPLDPLGCSRYFYMHAERWSTSHVCMIRPSFGRQCEAGIGHVVIRSGQGPEVCSPNSGSPHVPAPAGLTLRSWASALCSDRRCGACRPQHCDQERAGATVCQRCGPRQPDSHLQLRPWCSTGVHWAEQPDPSQPGEPLWRRHRARYSILRKLIASCSHSLQGR